MNQLHKEGVRESRLTMRRQHRFGLLRRTVPAAQQPVGQFIRRATPGAAVHHPLGDPPEILDQHNPQCDRDRPQFANGERLDLLIGTQVTAQDLRVEQAVRMGDERPGHAEHPRVLRERSAGELRQLPIVAGRQIGADFSDLLLDHIKVVDQPFGGRRDDRASVDRLGHIAIRREQHGFVVGKSRRQRGALQLARRHRLRRGEAAGVFFQTLDAEAFRPDGCAIVPRRRPSGIAQEAPQRQA